MSNEAPRTGKVREYLYDAEYDLRLGIGELMELEDKTGVGCGAVLAGLNINEFKVGHIVQIIRLGLIGSGEMKPRDAAVYLDQYLIKPVDQSGRSYIADYLPAAINALSAALYGVPEDPVPSGKDEAMDQTPIQTPEPDGVTFGEPLEPLELPPLNSGE